MGRPCTICSHPQREAINKALAAGYSYRDVAGYYAVSKTTLHRHWQAHVAAEPVGAPVAPRQVSGTPKSALIKWGLWAAGIVGVLLLMRRAARTNFDEARPHFVFPPSNVSSSETGATTL